MRINVLKVKLLVNSQIKDIQAFISELYAHQRKWYFSVENNPDSRVEIREDGASRWFGVFNEDNHPIACACLKNAGKQIDMADDSYLNNKLISNSVYQENSWEISKVGLNPQYIGFEVLQNLFLELFKYCEINHYNVFACTHDAYLKSFYNRIKFPLKLEGAFKYKSADEMPVDFYFASYQQEEVKTIISKLEPATYDAKDHFDQELKREQDKFKQSINQILHDIRSPLSSLSMIVSICTDIQEEDKVALRSAINRINDIANNLQNEYRHDRLLNKTGPVIDKYDSLLVSTALLEILGEKRYQYKLLNVRFEHNFSQISNFIFTNMNQAVFKRMISNVLNNAVEAVDPNSGIITVRLSVDNNLVKIVVQDNGRGISAELINQIMGKSDKVGEDSHHNTGLRQVRQTLEENKGNLFIDSVVGSGAKVIITFPKVDKPDWLADKIELNGDDLVVILDDEPSIHGAWNSRFRLHTKRVAIKHFESGREVINFINYLPIEKQKKIFLLVDYELQNQDINGLKVIEQTKVARSILVTSHYANKKLRAEVEALGTKLLPKMLAPEVTVTVDAKVEPAEGKKEVSLIFADDDKDFVTNMIRSLFAGQYVETFFDPEHLLQDILKYKKDTKICLDNNFEKSGIKGLEVAERLYEKGFTNLYMLSGNIIDTSMVPSYLRIILKNDLEGIKQMRDA